MVKIVLIIALKDDGYVFLPHHNIIILASRPGGLLQEVHREPTTYLPKSVSFEVPGTLGDTVLFGANVENMFTRTDTYGTAKRLTVRMQTGIQKLKILRVRSMSKK